MVSTQKALITIAVNPASYKEGLPRKCLLLERAKRAVVRDHSVTVPATDCHYHLYF